ncbi:MAG: site-2 protease family protein [Thermoplasmatales archaeon]|nr:site-2 protease family protein [Thermoplasmatales archaeon]
MDEIENIKRMVEKWFRVYDFRVGEGFSVFYCRINEATVENYFDGLVKEMKKMGCVPMLRKEKGEHAIYIVRKPRIKYRGAWVNLLLLIATVFTTVIAGVFICVPYFGGKILSIKTIFYSFIFFSLPLIIILGVHEMGHYFAAKRHNVKVSLPYFVPLPPPFILGTMGAFISLREPIPNKKVLLDVGAAGPICGFLVAVPVTVIGLFLTNVYAVSAPETGEMVHQYIMGSPLIYTFLSILVNSFIPFKEGIVIHPTAFAGWVGLFVTSLNLLPAGQLDGGHVFRSLFGEKSRYVSYTAVAFMIVLGLFYSGWFVFAFIILLLGVRHPPALNEVTELDMKRKLLGVFTILLLIICFVPVPMMMAQ